MTKLIIDLHALKTQLELNGSWYMAKQVGNQIERQIDRPCHFCGKPVEEASLKNHPECLSQLYDVMFEEKKAA